MLSQFGRQEHQSSEFFLVLQTARVFAVGCQLRSILRQRGVSGPWAVLSSGPGCCFNGECSTLPTAGSRASRPDLRFTGACRDPAEGFELRSPRCEL